MDVRSRRIALGVGLVLLILLDVALRRVDVFGLLASDSQPSTLFAAVNSQLTDLVHNLRGKASGTRPTVLVGNSQMDMGTRPLPDLRRALVGAGAPADTRLVPLMVYATTITDAEVTARSLADLGPGLVVLGVSPADVGTTLERARFGSVTRALDVGFREGLVPPPNLEARLDRSVRSIWFLYRYRSLLADALFPGSEPRTPRAFFETGHEEADFFATTHGPEEGRKLVELRRAALASGDFADVARYVEALQGPNYLPGLRERWRDLEPQALQLAALRRFAEQVREAGGRPVVVLLPENPLLERDPEVGAQVRSRSDAAAASVVAVAAEAGFPVVDLRHGTPPEAFLDLNHLFFEHGGLAGRLAAALAERGLL